MKRAPLLTALLLVGLMLPSAASAIVARDYSANFYTHRAQVQACGDGDGSVAIEIHVNGRGQLGHAEVIEGDARMRRVGACVLEHARSWTFMRSSTGRRARYSIDYTGERFVVRPRR